jgi:hypothetical protein
MKKTIICALVSIAILASGASRPRQSPQTKMREKIKVLQKENNEFKKQIALQNKIITQLKTLLEKNNIKISPAIKKYAVQAAKVASGPIKMGAILTFPNENFINVLNITGPESMTVKFSARKSHFPYSQERWKKMSFEERSRYLKKGNCVIIKGLSTKGIISDARLDLQGSFEITGTQSALNQFKEQKTLFVMEPIVEVVK